MNEGVDNAQNYVSPGEHDHDNSGLMGDEGQETTDIKKYRHFKQIAESDAR